MLRLSTLASVAMACACAMPALPACAQAQRQRAGPCDVYAPLPEDAGIRWDYWWSGQCRQGLATGSGFLFEYMRGGGFGDVYAVNLSEGRPHGEVTAWGPVFLATEWNVRVATLEPGNDWPEAWRPIDAGVSRFALPRALQEAVDRFAREVGHPQMPALPVIADGAACRASVEVDGVAVDVAGFMRLYPDVPSARRAALLSALTAQATRATPPRAELALAAAVAACR